MTKHTALTDEWLRCLTGQVERQLIRSGFIMKGTELGFHFGIRLDFPCFPVWQSEVDLAPFGGEPMECKGACVGQAAERVSRHHDFNRFCWSEHKKDR